MKTKDKPVQAVAPVMPVLPVRPVLPVPPKRVAPVKLVTPVKPAQPHRFVNYVATKTLYQMQQAIKEGVFAQAEIAKTCDALSSCALGVVRS